MRWPWEKRQDPPNGFRVRVVTPNGAPLAPWMCRAGMKIIATDYNAITGVIVLVIEQPEPSRLMKSLAKAP